MTGAAKAQVDEILYVPAALALHQRPAVPGIRSTFGTGTELAEQPASDVFPRLASHRCPNGHYVRANAGRWQQNSRFICPICKARVLPPSAEHAGF